MVSVYKRTGVCVAGKITWQLGPPSSQFMSSKSWVRCVYVVAMCHLEPGGLSLISNRTATTLLMTPACVTCQRECSGPVTVWLVRSRAPASARVLECGWKQKGLFITSGLHIRVVPWSSVTQTSVSAVIGRLPLFGNCQASSRGGISQSVLSQTWPWPNHDPDFTSIIYTTCIPCLG